MSLGKLCFPKQNLHLWLIDCNFRNISGLDSPQHNKQKCPTKKSKRLCFDMKWWLLNFSCQNFKVPISCQKNFFFFFFSIIILFIISRIIQNRIILCSISREIYFWRNKELKQVKTYVNPFKVCRKILKLVKIQNLINLPKKI